MPRSLLRAWITLLALSLATTFLAGLVDAGQVQIMSGLAILILAWAKARIILLDYLGLRRAPYWRGGVVAVIAGQTLLMAGLYLFPTFLLR